MEHCFQLVRPTSNRHSYNETEHPGLGAFVEVALATWEQSFFSAWKSNISFVKSLPLWKWRSNRSSHAKVGQLIMDEAWTFVPFRAYGRQSPVDKQRIVSVRERQFPPRCMPNCFRLGIGLDSDPYSVAGGIDRGSMSIVACHIPPKKVIFSSITLLLLMNPAGSSSCCRQRCLGVTWRVARAKPPWPFTVKPTSEVTRT